MDIQNIDLRRGDFEAMHPKAKLFGFDEDKKLYTGDGVESINDQWTTWCACIGMLRLDGKEAQAVPEGFVVVSQKDLLELTIAINAVDLATHTESKTNEVREMWQQVALRLMALGISQESAND